MRAGRAVFLAAILGLLVSCGRTGDGPTAPQAGPAAADGGEQAAAVSLKVVAPGELASLVAAERGKVVLVDFWATWCVPCIQQFPHTVELHRKLGPRGLSVISMSLDDPSSEERVLAFLTKQGATFSNFLSAAGGGSTSAEAFGIEGVPHYRIHDREGRIAKEFSADPSADAQFRPEDIEREIRRILDGKP